MSSRLPESYAQKNRFFNCRDQLCVKLDTGELILISDLTSVVIACAGYASDGSAVESNISGLPSVVIAWPRK